MEYNKADYYGREMLEFEFLGRQAKLVLPETPAKGNPWLIKTEYFWAFSEFERDMIVQRTQEGKEIAKQKEGYHEGRPKVDIDRQEFEKFREKQKDGDMTVMQCCMRLGISRSTWYNLVRGDET